MHAAAGGTGRLIAQMAKPLGARVFGTVSTEKAACRAAGADEAILYTEQDFETEARRLPAARGVDVVYDSVGRHVRQELARACARADAGAVRPVERPVPPFDPQVLSRGVRFS